MSEKTTETSDPVRLPDSEEESLNSLQRLGFYVALLFIFFRFSFLHEFIGAKVKANLHLIILIGGLCYLCAILSGHLFRAFEERSTWLWSGFAACFAVATVFSFWKGGSFPVLREYMETSFPAIVAIPALVVTRGQIRKVVSSIGLACFVTVALGTLNDDFRAGRMGVDVASSEIQNPNDYAAHLILMLPAVAFWAFRSGRPIVYRILGAGTMALCLRQILSSASRGALVSLAVTAIFLVFTGNKQIKMAILIGVPALALIALPFVPARSLSRLSTLMSSSAVAQHTEAQESSRARVALLRESLKLTLTHPLTGVGPGQFMDYQAKAAGENGQRGMWHVTHNSYTQVSSECGIPAFLFYMGAICLTFSYLRHCVKSADPEIAGVAYTVMVMIVGYGICIFFLSQAYSVHLLIVSGLAVSMRMTLGRQVKPEASTGASVQRAPEAIPA